MPYADPDERREYYNNWRREKYRKDRKFRHAESDRKAAWLQTPEGKQSNLDGTKRWLKKVRKAANPPAPSAQTSKPRPRPQSESRP